MAGSGVMAILIAAFYILFASISGVLSQLVLSPVYGSIPATAQHQRVLIWTLVLAVLARPTLKQYLPPKPRRYLPILAFYVPVVQCFVFADSGRLGSTNGPLVTEIVTYFPVSLLASICALDALDVFAVFRQTPAVQICFGALIYLAVSYGETLLAGKFSDLPAMSDLLSRINLQLLTAQAAATVSPSWMGLAAVPAVIHTIKFNPHFIPPRTPQLLENTLRQNKWSLLDRQDSVTGYVSVLENLEAGFRVLRCDHSLLGGEWLVTDKRRAEGITTVEPIYAVFEMLEAVRLVEISESRDNDKVKTALVVGLGVGTAPKALLAHGVATTIVELDPAVHEFATKYFDLPTNHTAVIQDAVSWVSSIASHNSKPSTIPQRYSYILHDVFTGGAEPLPLFTHTFLQNLRSLLAPNGVIAINYAGDASMTPTKQVLNTINTVFRGHCRIFRDSPLTDDQDSGFSNMVVFCLNPDDTGSSGSSSSNSSNKGKKRPTFRNPVEADYLGTTSRQHYLVPNPALELQFPDMLGEKVQLLTTGNMGSFQTQQIDSARRHWKIMRQVVPGVVWENW